MRALINTLRKLRGSAIAWRLSHTGSRERDLIAMIPPRILGVKGAIAVC